MNDDVKIFVNNQIKEYFQSNVLSYFKYVNEDIKQIDKEIEQISEEQNRLSLVLSSDPTKITKKDRELIDIINAYISKVNNIKKDAEESLQQVINDLDSKAIKDKKDALRLNVYQKNTRAIHFYQREGFEIQCEGLDEATGEKDYVMIWQQK